MVQYGDRTSFYAQKELENLLDLALKAYPERWKSRSNLINTAICKFLRELMPAEFRMLENTTPGKIYVFENHRVLSKEE